MSARVLLELLSWLSCSDSLAAYLSEFLMREIKLTALSREKHTHWNCPCPLSLQVHWQSATMSWGTGTSCQSIAWHHQSARWRKRVTWRLWMFPSHLPILDTHQLHLRLCPGKDLKLVVRTQTQCFTWRGTYLPESVVPGNQRWFFSGRSLTDRRKPEELKIPKDCGAGYVSQPVQTPPPVENWAGLVFFQDPLAPFYCYHSPL